mmetsp:Transcript_83323/g.193596  ORF Transcript_83323/g.193596 Transcript_83323/m.193596 type:complete len:276 (+) Transcript_83323:981-1808(+)
MNRLNCFECNVPANLHSSRHDHSCLGLLLLGAGGERGVLWPQLPSNRAHLQVCDNLFQLLIPCQSPCTGLCKEPCTTFFHGEDVLFWLRDNLLTRKLQLWELLVGIVPVYRTKVKEIHAVDGANELLHVRHCPQIHLSRKNRPLTVRCRGIHLLRKNGPFTIACRECAQPGCGLWLLELLVQVHLTVDLMQFPLLSREFLLCLPVLCCRLLILLLSFGCLLCCLALFHDQILRLPSLGSLCEPPPLCLFLGQCHAAPSTHSSAFRGAHSPCGSHR